MSTDLAQRAQEAHKRHVKVAENHLAGGVAVAALWYWPILILVGVVLTYAETIPGVEMGEAGLGHAADISQGQAARVFLLVMGIVMSVVMLPRFLAGGGTRKALVEGAVRAAFFCGIGMAVVALLLRLTERLVLDRTGLLPWDEYEMDPSGGWVIISGVLHGTWLLAGMAISLFYLRFAPWAAAHGLRGRLAWPAALVAPLVLVLPAVLGELGFRSGPFGAIAELWVPGGFLGAVVGLLVALAGGFVVLVVLDHLVSGIALAPVSSSVHIKVR